MTQFTYMLPSATVPVPNGLTLTQYLQTIFVGLTEIPGPFIRPKWQVDPPKQPDITVNWMAIGINSATPDANGFLGTDGSGVTDYQRHEMLEIGLSIYGPEALTIYGLVRDGFQIPQNLYALRAADMGFVEVGPALKVPDLVHERWVNRIETSVFIRRETQRTYPIPILISANGVIHTVIGNEEYLLDWET